MRYEPAAPEREAFRWLEQRIGRALPHDFELQRAPEELRGKLAQLAKVRGRAASFLPETSFFAVELAPNRTSYFTVLRDSAHTNVAEVFHEDDRRIPAEDELSVVPGLLGAYPNALFAVAAKDLAELVATAENLDSAGAYRNLRTRFGMRRSNPHFWDFSDALNAAHQRSSPLERGILDYNRLEAY